MSVSAALTGDLTTGCKVLISEFSHFLTFLLTRIACKELGVFPGLDLESAVSPGSPVSCH